MITEAQVVNMFSDVGQRVMFFLTIFDRSGIPHCSYSLDAIFKSFLANAWACQVAKQRGVNEKLLGVNVNLPEARSEWRGP